MENQTIRSSLRDAHEFLYHHSQERNPWISILEVRVLGGTFTGEAVSHLGYLCRWFKTIQVRQYAIFSWIPYTHASTHTHMKTLSSLFTFPLHSFLLLLPVHTFRLHLCTNLTLAPSKFLSHLLLLLFHLHLHLLLLLLLFHRLLAHLHHYTQTQCCRRPAQSCVWPASKGSKLSSELGSRLTKLRTAHCTHTFSTSGTVKSRIIFNRLFLIIPNKQICRHILRKYFFKNSWENWHGQIRNTPIKLPNKLIRLI